MIDVIINADKGCLPENAVELNGAKRFMLNVLTAMGDEASSLPLGDFLRQYHSLSGKWLVLTPIYWQATHNDAMIIAAGQDLQFSEDEAREWYAALADFLQVENIRLYYHDKYTWLINIDGLPDISSKPAELILHQSMMPALAAMDKSLHWQKRLTELQMFLSNHSLNNKRTDRCPVNGVWAFGGGVFEWPQGRVILSDDHDLQAHFSSYIQPWLPEQVLPDNALVIISNAGAGQLNLRQNNGVRWYWNDIAYQTSKKKWWKRFLRG
ncbi:hypothetical protein ACFORL_01130 [Legionella dresdenensis]|uniref:Cofactor-independent phosphoglycerate mutase n=1 Tax=Legionella dresdenensis TaxID=450200 RepID=A0ABV8CBW4_9GAMM